MLSLPFNRRILAALSILLLNFSVCISAYAHQIRMSVYTEENSLDGEIYFVGGGNPPGAGALVELKQGDTVIATTVADEEGLFLFSPVTPDNYSVRADGKQGHVAFAEVAKTDFPGFEPEQALSANNSEQNSQALADNTQCSTISAADLQTAISKAIRPLREQIDHYEAKTRMHDVLGGIGYIFGLFGLFMFVRTRQSNK